MSTATFTTRGPSVDGVRVATEADVDILARTLASAFHDDPVFHWCLPDASLRERHLTRWFAVVVEALLEHDETYCTDGGFGTALWVPPGVAALTEEQGQLLGAVTADMGAAALDRTAALTEVMEAHHPQEAHLYLWFTGVHASRQGEGWGGRLLAARLARADEQGMSAYLEATTERNRALYERHGFEVTGVISAQGSPPLWQMWRDPS